MKAAAKYAIIVPPAPRPPTPRQREILAKIASGLNQKEVAEQLGVSHQYIRNHLNQLFRRWNVNSAEQAIAIALAHGYIRLEVSE